MENNRYETGLHEEIVIGNDMYRILNNIAKWTGFLSVLGFIVLGLMALFVILAGVMISGMNEYALQNQMYPYVPGVFGWGYALVYLVVLLIYFIPLYYLYKFSRNIKIKSHSNMREAFVYLNKHYTFIGVLAIVWIILFIISCVMMLLGMGRMM